MHTKNLELLTNLKYFGDRTAPPDILWLNRLKLNN